MAIKVGNSYVSEAAYAYAKQKEDAEKQDTSVMQQLSERFKDVNFTTNTAPFNGKGVNNIAISPNILQEMESNPDKRLEYEALIYDCNSINKMLAGKSTITGKKIADRGFIINSDGTLGSWCITRSSGAESRSSILLPRDNKQSWLAKILEDNSLNKVNQYA